jgi:hypothetical protein
VFVRSIKDISEEETTLDLCGCKFDNIVSLDPKFLNLDDHDHDHESACLLIENIKTQNISATTFNACVTNMKAALYQICNTPNLECSLTIEESSFTNN